jgi:GNAT superfamily N-acetyltransferase
VIRRAVHGDVFDIERIVRVAYAKYVPRIGVAPGPLGDDYAARVAEGTVWVAARADAAIAGLVVLLPRSDHLLLDNVAVDPTCQGTGVGRALLAFAEDEARRGGWRELRLYTHQLMTENIALYRRNGWIETGRGMQEGFARVFFRKAVA